MKKYKKYQVFCFCVVINALLIGMEIPKYSRLQIRENPLLDIGNENDEKNFKLLMENKALRYRILIAQEQAGQFTRDLYDDLQETRKILDRHKSKIDFISCRNTQMFLIDVLLQLRCRPELISDINDGTVGDFRFTAKYGEMTVNTYGRDEPYKHKVLTPLLYVLAKTAGALFDNATGLARAKLLLEHNANPNALDCDGRSSMHYASTPDLVMLLWKFGAKNNIKDFLGNNPLLHHIRLKNWPVVECLLYDSSIINESDGSHTPLHLAIECCPAKTLQLLLKNGADYTLKDKEGKTPEYYANSFNLFVLNSYKEMIGKDEVEIMFQSPGFVAKQLEFDL